MSIEEQQVSCIYQKIREFTEARGEDVPGENLECSSACWRSTESASLVTFSLSCLFSFICLVQDERNYESTVNGLVESPQECSFRKAVFSTV